MNQHAVRWCVHPVEEYAHDAQVINGYEIPNKYFDMLFSHNPKVAAGGEDVGDR